MKDKFKHLWVPEGGPVWGRKQHPIGTLEGITKEREREILKKGARMYKDHIICGLVGNVKNTKLYLGARKAAEKF